MLAVSLWLSAGRQCQVEPVEAQVLTLNAPPYKGSPIDRPYQFRPLLGAGEV